MAIVVLPVPEIPVTHKIIFDRIELGTYLIAAALDPTMRSAALGIVFGGIIPLLGIPLLERYVTKSEQHIIVGDHEDIEKDLHSSHDN